MTSTATSGDTAQHLSDLINGFWAAQVINAAATLQIPDRLAGGAMTADALAVAVQGHGPSVFRLMRAMETLGLCASDAEGRFSLTEAGQPLRADAPGSVRGRAMFTGDMLWKQFGDLSHIVRTGERARTVESGSEGFAALQADPARLHAFQQAMAEGSVVAAREALKVYDFSQFRSILDLGGGYGGVLSVLLSANPGQSGAVCDLGYLEAGASAYLAKAGVADRSRFMPGDFFSAVPEGFDAYVMKYIVHDWDDEHARTILRNCRKAAAGTAKVVLLEQVVPERLHQTRADQAVIRADLTMMAVGGKERTAGEYRALLAEAGWTLTTIVPAGPVFSVIEAVLA